MAGRTPKPASLKLAISVRITALFDEGYWPKNLGYLKCVPTSASGATWWAPAPAVAIHAHSLVRLRFVPPFLQ